VFPGFQNNALCDASSDVEFREGAQHLRHWHSGGQERIIGEGAGQGGASPSPSVAIRHGVEKCETGKKIKPKEIIGN